VSAARHWTKGHGDDYLSRSAIVGSSADRPLHPA